jgi:hypothetical protein
MIPLKGVYMMLVLLGTPEQIGLKQMTSYEPYAKSGRYSIVSCMVDGAIISPTLAQKQGQQLLEGLVAGAGRSGLIR